MMTACRAYAVMLVQPISTADLKFAIITTSPVDYVG